MRKLFLAVSLFLAGTAMAAPFSSTKPVMCGTYQDVVVNLSSQYEEKAIFTGKDLSDDTYYILFTNPKTSSWTFVQTNGNVACVLGTGDKSELQLGTSV